MSLARCSCGFEVDGPVYSAAWHRLHREHHLVAHPLSDERTRRNLDELVDWQERRERARALAEEDTVVVVRVTAAHRGTGAATVIYGDLITHYAVDSVRDNGVVEVRCRVVFGALLNGAVGDAIIDLVTSSVRRGVGTERYNLRHSEDGTIVARSVSMVEEVAQ